MPFPDSKSTAWGFFTDDEITRNIAPYIGVVWDRKLGETASIARTNGEAVGSLFVAGGVRVLW